MTPDSKNFPTAIVPNRSYGSTREKFDTLARRLGDPMARLFLLQEAKKVDIDGVERPDTEMQFKAAAELMPYRYPKLKVAEVHHTGAGGAGLFNIQINLGVAPKETTQEVEVSPSVVSSVTSPVDPLD